MIDSQTIPPDPQVISDGQPEQRSASWYRWVATSEDLFPRLLRGIRRAVLNFSLPVPHRLVKPILWLYVSVRSSYLFAKRVFICEPLFKGYCRSYGKRVRTGSMLHWVMGRGDIVLGDNVWLDGKIEIAFAARFADRPVLEIGDNTAVGHACRFVVGKRIAIGRNCTVSGGTTVMDSNGHRTDVIARLEQRPPSDEEVRPVVIGDNVWIGMQCIIFPGVRIGEGSVVSAGSIVRTHVPPYHVVAGNPAKVMFRLKKPAPSVKDL